MSESGIIMDVCKLIAMLSPPASTNYKYVCICKNAMSGYNRRNHKGEMKSIPWFIFQPLRIRLICLDSEKLYIVTTKLTKLTLTSSPGRFSVVLAM